MFQRIDHALVLLRRHEGVPVWRHVWRSCAAGERACRVLGTADADCAKLLSIDLSQDRTRKHDVNRDLVLEGAAPAPLLIYWAAAQAASTNAATKPGVARMVKWWQPATSRLTTPARGAVGGVASALKSVSARSEPPG